MSASTIEREPLIRLCADFLLAEAEYRRLTATEDATRDPKQRVALWAERDTLNER